LLGDVNPKFLSDKEIVLHAVKVHGISIRHASEQLKHDEEVISAALKNDIEAFEYISAKRRNEVDFCEKYIKFDGRFLCYTGDKVRSNKKMVELAMSTYKKAIHCVHPTLLKYKRFAVAMVKTDPMMVYELPKHLQNDEDVVIAIAKTLVGYEYIRIPTGFLENKKAALKAMEIDDRAYEFVTDTLKSDNQFIVEAIKVNIFSESM
jgi:hypothetical protein